MFNLLPLKDKTTFVVSFGDNSEYVFEEMRRQGIQNDVVFLCKGKSRSIFESYDSVTLLSFESTNVIETVKSIYHLATSKQIVIDNYFGFLAVTDFKKGVECIQLWHATGAIKKFGLQDKSVEYRSERAVRRFKSVYRKFDKVVVGSDIMATIFKEAFDLEDANFIKTGIPRTDFFFNEEKKQTAIQRLISENKILSEKKVILYAPTYRDNELKQFKMKLDLEKLHSELGEEYILLLRLHPAVRFTEDYTKKYPEFVFDYSSGDYHINELLLVSDLLITDYSSIPYEYSLLGRPMIFFTFDLETYKQERGIWDGFEQGLPGPIAMDTNTIIQIILKGQYDYNLISDYSNTWNKYSIGHSSYNVVRYLYGEKLTEPKRQKDIQT
ncbi:CDP-glycerol glycerophosphotransferase family protein [Mesobacillus maritimus]|uniref:CDP-glycerol glycerophosphotransferase family protein n=1 Tax=Mesobacillus maritimus TaxID=1643336 RepID=UPI0020418FFF|nr:CDP-glycerol glycerophosphotransferase family protein [Mesobacillus maritimus]MCM3668080.1 CDP-glycerol glycerophosphotransferase family protein [Mesobacillus maritimus]